MGRDPVDKPRSSTGNRSATNTEKRASRRQNRGNGSVADWHNVDPATLHNVVVAVTGQRCAIQFGYTTDGGSYVIRIVGDAEQPYNEYCRPTEDINAHLKSIAMDFEK